MATTEKGIYYPDNYSEAADIPADMHTMAESVDTAIGNSESTIDGQISVLQQNVQENTVFVKKEKTVWECRNCGHIVEGEEAPDVCPACDYAKSFFEVHAENY